jgi:hypothetical protein
VPQLPPDVAKAVAAVCERVMPDAPFNFRAAMTRPAVDMYQTQFTRAADGIRQADGFSDPEKWRFDWEWSYTRDEWLEQMPTQGAFTRLPPPRTSSRRCWTASGRLGHGQVLAEAVADTVLDVGVAGCERGVEPGGQHQRRAG